jgi:hypothetical protein
MTWTPDATFVIDDAVGVQDAEIADRRAIVDDTAGHGLQTLAEFDLLADESGAMNGRDRLEAEPEKLPRIASARRTVRAADANQEAVAAAGVPGKRILGVEHYAVPRGHEAFGRIEDHRDVMSLRLEDAVAKLRLARAPHEQHLQQLLPSSTGTRPATRADGATVLQMA